MVRRLIMNVSLSTMRGQQLHIHIKEEVTAISWSGSDSVCRAERGLGHFLRPSRRREG